MAFNPRTISGPARNTQGGYAPAGKGYGPIQPALTTGQQAMRAQTAQGVFGKYAWHFLTSDQQDEYATWKSGGASGDQSIQTGAGAMPKNWQLLESGDLGTATPVGLTGLGYLGAAVAHMQAGGSATVWAHWASSIGSPIAQSAAVT